MSSKNVKKGTFEDLVPALGLSLFALVFGTFAAYAPPSKGEMAVVFRPGTSESDAYRAIISSGGQIVGTSRFDNIVVAYARDEEFAVRVSKYGGWFTLAATGLCSSLGPELRQS